MNRLEEVINKISNMGYKYEWQESTGFHIFKNESETISIYDSENVNKTIEDIEKTFNLQK